MQLFRKDRPLTPSWDLLQPGLQLVRENIWPLFYLSFLPSLVSVVGLVLAGSPESNPGTLHFDNRVLSGLGIAVLGGLASMLTYPGLIYLQTRAIRGEHPTASECFKAGLRRLLPLIATTLLQAIAIMIGLFLFIIPGLILIRAFLLAPYYVVDKKLGPVNALKKSYEDTKPVAGWIWGTLAIIIIFGILGSSLSNVPVLGYLLSLAASYIYVFAPAFRYGEIALNLRLKKAA